MILLLSTVANLQGCMNDNTQLTLNTIENEIELRLVPSGDVDCIVFPSAVQIQLRFADEVLDLQIVVTDYNYHKTLLVVYQVADVTDYLKIDSAIMTIKSYSEVYSRNVLEIVIQRAETSLVVNKIVSSSYNGQIVTVVVELNDLIKYPIKRAILTICTDECETFNEKTITSAANIWTIVIPAPGQRGKISKFNIQKSELTLFYGNLVQSSVYFGDFGMELSYQTAIGTLTEIFIYQNEIYFHIESSEEFFAYAKGTIGIDLTFDFGICKLYTKTTLSEFLYHKYDIELQFTKSQFTNSEQFENCTQSALNQQQQARLIVDLKGVLSNASYMLTSYASYSFFVDSNIIVADSEITIFSKVLPQTELQPGNYKYQLESYDSLEDQLLQNGNVIFESSLNFTAAENFTLKLAKTPSLADKISGAYSIYLVIVDGAGVNLIDGKLQVYNTASKQFTIFNIIVGIIMAVISICIGGMIIFWKPKARRRKIAKEIKMEDL